MNILESQRDQTSVEELKKEIRRLTRKLALAEANLARAQLITAAQDRAENILSASLQKEIQFFKLVLENATNILLLFDFDGRFAYASQTFLTDAGIANFGLINGRQFQEVLRPIISAESLERFSAALNCAVTQKKTITLEDQIDFNLKGLPRIFSILVTPMTDENGESIGIMALFNDITEINNALEAANRASLAKSDFLANMSHEIRTPLNAVIGMAAIAQNSLDTEKIHYCLSKINDSSTHLLGVINDILDMSKIETNHFELSFCEFVFERMLLRIVDVMRFKMEEKNIKFSLYCDSDIPYSILSDEQRLAQVIMNLLSNAVKFTPEDGEVSVFAQVESFEGDEYTLRITVKDSGIGISDEQKPRLFKAFSQADSSISRKFGGTGLGLVISKNIINLLGGDISFESVKDVGTTFIFYIKTRACLLNPVSRADCGFGILAVDSDRSILSNLSLYAKKLGLPCVTAEAPEQALEFLKEHPKNIVFADWEIESPERLSFFKHLCELSEQAVIVMSSATDWTEIEKDAKPMGVREVVSKPVLLPVIEDILDKYHGSSLKKEAEAFDDFSGKTVLLADDIEINREIIISLLEHTGIEIVCVENGREALTRFTAEPKAFDLIFMDVQMPEMDGYEATRRIRASGAKTAAKVPIVAMTANVFKEDIERCLESGMNDHIGKPVNLDEILAKIKQWTQISIR